MFCPNCGRRIPDDSRFCSGCGINLKKAAEIFDKLPYSEQEERRPVRNPYAAQAQTETLPKIPEELLLPPEEEEKEEKEKGGEEERRKPNFMIIGLIAATFLASLIITIVIFSGVGKNSTAVIYLSDSKYGVIGDLESGTAIDLIGSKTDEWIPNLQFCSNGKTIYFLTRFDGISGNLNRAEYTKLSMTGTRNEDQIEQVASDVAAFEACGDSGVLYSTASRTLYYYDGSESTQIGKLVCHYLTDEKGRILYAAGEDNDITIYGAQLSDPDNRQKLVSGLSDAAAAALFSGEEPVNFDHIPFLQDGSLYTIGFDRQPELLAENVILGAKGLEGQTSAAYPQSAFLYLVPAPGATAFSCYEHLAEDPGAVKDSVVKPPSEESYRTPVYETVQVTDPAAAEASYPELYASCTLGLAGLENVSIEEVSLMTGVPSSRMTTLAQEFVAKYQSMENAEGLIGITEDIKADLKKLADAAGVRNWLLFCLTKQQSGTELDQAAYERAMESYRTVKARNEYRTVLKQEQQVYSLWYFKNGTTVNLQDDVLFTAEPEESGAVRFITAAACEEWLERKSFTAMYDHGTAIFQDDLEQMAAILPVGTVVTIPANTLPVSGDTSKLRMMLTESAAAVLTEEGDLYLGVIKNRTVGGLKLEAQKAGLIPTEENDRIYYQANSYKVGTRKYADLYTYENGTSLCLGKELVNDSPVLFCDEGGMLACTDYQSGRGRELTLFTANGDAKYIADGVTDYKWISQNEIVYLSDGDLYLYRNGSHMRLKNDVEQFWTNGGMKARTLHFEVVIYN